MQFMLPLYQIKFSGQKTEKYLEFYVGRIGPWAGWELNNFCLIVFYVRPLYFYSLFKVRRNVIGCINHAIVIDLCSKLLMSLSYYIHLGYGKNIFLSHMGIERGCSRPATTPLDQ